MELGPVKEKPIENIVKSIFPAAQIVTLNTGHWVQAENPAAFSSTVLQFLNQA